MTTASHLIADPHHRSLGFRFYRIVHHHTVVSVAVKASMGLKCLMRKIAEYVPRKKEMMTSCICMTAMGEIERGVGGMETKTKPLTRNAKT
jgi:hypothetical protein